MSKVKIMIRAGESLVGIEVDRDELARRLTSCAEISRSKGKRPGQPPNSVGTSTSYSPETLCTRFVAIEAPKKTNNP